MGLRYEPEAAAAIATLGPAAKREVRAAIDRLAEDPRPRGLDWKRLETAQTNGPVFRLRIGDYRVVYVVEGGHTRIMRVFHRREGYDWMHRLGL
jgi:mRNA-degrading endonuclease RelE of RelBE toxin-antitoxin system